MTGQLERLRQEDVIAGSVAASHIFLLAVNLGWRQTVVWGVLWWRVCWCCLLVVGDKRKGRDHKAKMVDTAIERE